MTGKRKHWAGYLCIWSLTMLFGILLGGTMHINDGFWHVAVGRQIWETGLIPRTAVGAWDAGFLSWIPQEWLYAVIVAGLFDGNLNAFCVFSFLCMSFAWFLAGIYAKLPERLFDKLVSVLVYVYAGSVMLAGFLTARPQTVSILLFTVFLHLFRQMVQGERLLWKQKAVLFGLVVFWANVHAGTVILAYAIPLCCIAFCWFCRLVPQVAKRMLPASLTPGVSRNLSSIGLISVLGTFLTPNGVLGFLYPYVSLGDSRMLSAVSEWAAPSVTELSGLLGFYIPLAAVLFWMVFVWSPSQKVASWDMVCLAACFGMGLLHQRMVLYLYPVLVLCWTPYLKRHLCRRSFVFRKMFGSLCKMVSLILFVCNVCMVYQMDHASEGVSNPEFFETVKAQAGDRMYNFYDIGGVCLYYDIPVFVDSRYDPYSSTRMDAVFVLEEQDSSSDMVSQVMDAYQFTSILDLSDSTAVAWAKSNGWQKVTKWDTGLVQTKASGQRPVVYEFWVPGS